MFIWVRSLLIFCYIYVRRKELVKERKAKTHLNSKDFSGLIETNLRKNQEHLDSKIYLERKIG